MEALPALPKNQYGKHNIQEEAEYNRQIKEIYANMMDEINKEINGFYSRYAAKEGITMAEARRLALDYRYTGYKSLPPGIQKNLARGKPLPPGIAKKMVPSRMLSRLPRHAGYEWRIAGTDLILVAIATNVVADVLSGVFR